MSDTFRPTPRKPITTEERVAALEERIEAHERATTAAQASMVELARQEAASIRGEIKTAQKEIADDVHSALTMAEESSKRGELLRGDLSEVQTQVRLLSERPEFDLRRSELPINGLDLTDALDWAFRHKSRDHEIIVPPGSPSGARPRWQLSRTLEFPRQHGGAIRFVGESSNNHYAGLHCEIEWAGEKGGTMFLYSSTDWKFRGSPHFYGKSALCPEGAGIGFLTTKNGSYNAGRMDWEAGHWHDFKVGTQIGKEVTEASNECNSWGEQGYGGCEVGVRVVGHQALQQRYRSVFFAGDVVVGYQYFASGCLWVDETYLNGLLLELNNASDWNKGTGNKGTGKNNGVFRFANIKSDSQAKKPQLLRCTSPVAADVVFDTGVLSGTDTYKEPVIQTKAGCVVTCRNMRMGGTIEGDGGVVILDACRLMSNTSRDPFAKRAKGGVKVRERDCFNLVGEPLQ